MLRLLALLPALALFGARLDDEVEAGRRRRRKARHRKRQNRRQRNSGKGTAKKRPCKAEPKARTCNETCGTVRNNCRKKVNCGSCPGGEDCISSSLQEAIDAANNGDTIHICAGTFSGNITIGKDVTLIGAGDGSGSGNTILQGNENGTVVTIAGGANVTLQNLRMTKGDNIDAVASPMRER